MQRTSLVIVFAAAPVFWFYLGESSGARPYNLKTWPALQAGADVIAIVGVTSTKDLPSDDKEIRQAQESLLRVLTVLKGEDVPPQLRLLHYRYKRVDEGGPGNQVINACGYLKLKVSPGEEQLQEQPSVAPSRPRADAGANSLGTDVRVGRVAAGAASARVSVPETPSREGHYLMFLTRRSAGRMVPVTGDCDPANSVFALSQPEDFGW